VTRRRGWPHHPRRRAPSLPARVWHPCLRL